MRKLNWLSCCGSSPTSFELCTESKVKSLSLLSLLMLPRQLSGKTLTAPLLRFRLLKLLRVLNTAQTPTASDTVTVNLKRVSVAAGSADNITGHARAPQHVNSCSCNGHETADAESEAVLLRAVWLIACKPKATTLCDRSHKLLIASYHHHHHHHHELQSP